MVHISPGGENFMDFLELRQVLSTYEWEFCDPLSGPWKGQSPCELLGGHTGASQVSSPVDAGA